MERIPVWLETENAVDAHPQQRTDPSLKKASEENGLITIHASRPSTKLVAEFMGWKLLAWARF